MDELGQLETALSNYLHSEQWARIWPPSSMHIEFLPSDLTQALILTNLKLIEKIRELEKMFNLKVNHSETATD